MRLRPNVEITEGAFEKGALYTSDGKLTVFKRGFGPDHVMEAVEQIDLATQVDTLHVSKAGWNLPALPLGCIPGLVLALGQAAIGRHVTRFSLMLSDGRIIVAKASPRVFRELNKAARPRHV